MARENNNNVASSSSLTLTISHYAASARSICYTLPEALQALCTKNTSVYIKLSSLVVDKAGNIPSSLAMGSNGFTPLAYCAIDALDVPAKALETYNSPDAFYTAVREGLGATPVQPKVQETITRPRNPKAPAPTVVQVVPPVKPNGRITGPKNPAPTTKPLPVAAQATPDTSRIDAVESGLAALQASNAELATNMAALIAALTGKGGKK